jgi:hypothetical protein
MIDDSLRGFGCHVPRAEPRATGGHDQPRGRRELTEHLLDAWAIIGNDHTLVDVEAGLSEQRLGGVARSVLTGAGRHPVRDGHDRGSWLGVHPPILPSHRPVSRVPFGRTYRTRGDDMSDWIDDLATSCGQQPLTDAEIGELLRIAREVAHRVERKGTPLAAFLLGMRVEGSVANGTSRAVALAEGIGLVEALLPPSEDP